MLLDATGKQARGVRYLDLDGNAHEVSARVVIAGGGAWETPRLMLRSGIANSSDLVGRYLMYHFQTFVIGQFPFRLHGHRGRAVTHLHDDHMIVDDDALVRSGLVLILGGVADIDVVGQAVDGRDGVAAVRAHRPDIVLMDISMPGMDGVALIRAAQALRPRLPAILLTGYAGAGAALAVGGAVSGSFSLLQKPVSAVQLADRISALLAEQFV